MKPYFATPARCRLLIDQAYEWLGTPFFPNSSALGRGVSCQKLCAELYKSSGFGELEVPDVAMTPGRLREKGQVEEFMEGHPEFVRIEGTTDTRTGDLLGFRIGHSIHHLGVCMHTGTFIHSAPPSGVQLGYLADPTWDSRLAAVWRPYSL